MSSAAHHELRCGPARRSALTIIQHSEVPCLLRMEIRAGLLGTLGLDMESKAWGDGTFVTVREHPLSPNGLHSFVQSVPLMMLLRQRHRRMLFNTELAQPVQLRR